MNKLGRFWAKNTTHILGLIFLGWAIWACLHWASLCLVQKLVIGLFFLLVAHEYEEAYKERFIRVMGQALRITPEELPVPGLIHVALVPESDVARFPCVYPGHLRDVCPQLGYRDVPPEWRKPGLVHGYASGHI